MQRLAHCRRAECKKPVRRRAFFRRSTTLIVAPCRLGRHHPNLGSHCLDGSGQTRLCACSLVLVDDLLVSDAVDRALSSLECSSSGSLVAGGHSFANALDCGTQTRAQSRVVSVLNDGLACALACLCGVCHGKIPEETVASAPGDTEGRSAQIGERRQLYADFRTQRKPCCEIARITADCGFCGTFGRMASRSL